ncbi:hypothetical protein PG630_10685 [Riemerella anatipestifer]|nr:hypothetical protein [Riemerella anatipestifer]
MDDDDNSFRKINAIIRGKLHIDPTKIKDVEEWVEAYCQADYLMKLDKTLIYASVKQAAAEIVSEIFKKEDDES